MHRPFFKHSIDDLGREFTNAAREGRVFVLMQFVYELSFRKTPKARELTSLVNETLQQNRTPKNQSQHKTPPHTSKRASGHTSPPPSSKHPTGEQSEAIAAFLRGGSLRINAYAGTGKTSTLEMLAHSTSKRGQYIAFNKSIVNDAQTRFPKTVNCSTSHSLAFKATPSRFRTNEGKMTE